MQISQNNLMNKVLIVEDEIILSNHLSLLLNKLYPNELVVEQQLDNISETINWLNKNTPDLIFMDIQLSDGLCFEIFNKINVNCPVIFTTAFDQYAIKAFKTNGIDYLLKPIKETDLKLALNKFFSILKKIHNHSSENEKIRFLKFENEKSYKDRFLVKLGNKYTPIQIKDIAYFYKDEITFAKSFDGNTYPLNKSLSNIESSVDDKLFFRANRTFLVNINAIEYLSQYKPGQLTIRVKPKFDELIILSQEKSSYLKAMLN
jgi:DNA-binding LytR/AlgR family response regulator